jgi:hypothetical protein
MATKVNSRSQFVLASCFNFLLEEQPNSAKNMTDSADQLISFLLYSVVVYPLTNYILSPERGIPKWRAIVLATGLLAIVAYLQLVSFFDSCTIHLNYFKLLELSIEQ